jgi:hypothetical protein
VRKYCDEMWCNKAAEYNDFHVVEASPINDNVLPSTTCFMHAFRKKRKR